MTYHAYVHAKYGPDGEFYGPFEVYTEESARNIIEDGLNRFHPGKWKYDGSQYVFKDGKPGDFVAAYYTEVEEEKRAAERHAQWLAELPEYGIYGKAGRERITSDAQILAGLVTSTAEIEEDARELWDRFVAAGGDNSHSGGSWYCVKSEAYAIVKEREEATPA